MKLYERYILWGMNGVSPTPEKAQNVARDLLIEIYEYLERNGEK